MRAAQTLQITVIDMDLAVPHMSRSSGARTAILAQQDVSDENSALLLAFSNASHMLGRMLVEHSTQPRGCKHSWHLCGSSKHRRGLPGPGVLRVRQARRRSCTESGANAACWLGDQELGADEPQRRQGLSDLNSWHHHCPMRDDQWQNTVDCTLDKDKNESLIRLRATHTHLTLAWMRQALRFSLPPAP